MQEAQSSQREHIEHYSPLQKSMRPLPHKAGT